MKNYMCKNKKNMLEELWRRVIASGRHLELQEIDLEWWKIYESTARVGNKNAVAWLVRHIEHQSYILIEQYRYPVKNKVLELVAGLIDKPWLKKEQIMREEIYEETGYREVWEIEFLARVTSSAGKSSEITYLYDVEISGERGEQDLWEMEDITVFEIPYKDFRRFEKSKKKQWILIDPKVCMAVYETLEKIEIF